jgi:uncharacterized protein (TIGR03032 family)
LATLGCALVVSTYQAGQVLVLGVVDEALHVVTRCFDRAMGVAMRDGEMAVATRDQVWFLAETPELAAQVPPQGAYDRCFLPRRTVVTGGMQAHEMAFGGGHEGPDDLWIVNTLFSCLVGLDERFNFVPRWRPPFISAYAAEDRCHLNGVAMAGGRPAFVTAMAASDDRGGWRRARNDAGIVLHVPTGERVSTGLSMPHSPRVHGAALFVLNSGYGRLEHVDTGSGERQVVALMPGYCRGLALREHYAFIGLSRVRDTNVFGGAPIAAHHDDLVCGVGVVDLRTGATVATFVFTGGVDEIFDVQVLPDTRCAVLGGSAGEADEIWYIPGYDG